MNSKYHSIPENCLQDILGVTTVVGLLPLPMAHLTLFFANIRGWGDRRKNDGHARIRRGGARAGACFRLGRWENDNHRYRGIFGLVLPIL